MIEHMTEAELKEIETRCNTATPGPWKVNDQVFGQSVTRELIAPINSGRGCKPIAKIYMGFTDDEPSTDLLLHSRTDIPALIAEVRRLEAENNKLQDIIQGMGIELTELRVNKICMDEHERIYEALGCKYEGEALAKIQALKTHFCEIGPDQYFDGKS